MANKVKITQVRSAIGRPGAHKRTLWALGLRRVNHTVVREDNASIQGMIFQVKHLIEVEQVKD
jgi:large subunit ribosomal protein L30